MELILTQINQAVHSIVWGPFMLFIMAGVGIYFTVKTKFFQIRRSRTIIKNTVGAISSSEKKHHNGVISSFQAATTSLAGCLGTGNIVGVATALVSGGAGALFWMWISAFFGMMTKYAEILLSCYFKDKNSKGESVGGPMYYIEKGLHQKWLAVVFAICCTLASFGIGNMTQINSIVNSMQTVSSIHGIWIGILMAVIVGFVIIGGIKRIARFSAVVVPFFAVFYTVGAVVVLLFHWRNIPSAFEQIFSDAFRFQSAGGGILGYISMNAVRYGFSRGVFSNEAGLGSSSIAHAASECKDPVKEGMWGIFEVFVDTIVMCTITGLAILSTEVMDTGLNGAELTLAAFSSAYGSGLSNLFLTISIVFFAFSTLIGWSYYGEQCINYLFHNRLSIFIYKVLYLICILVGSVMELKLVWEISDTLNGMMAIPNLIALIGLRGIVIKLTKNEPFSLLKRK